MKRYAVIRTDLSNTVIGFAASIDEGHQLIERWVRSCSQRERRYFDVIDLHELGTGRLVSGELNCFRYIALEDEPIGVMAGDW